MREPSDERLFEKTRTTLDTTQIQPNKETLEKANIAKKYIEERYERLFEEERNRLMYWSLLNKKMKDLNLSAVEQKLIREDFMKQEALMYRDKYACLTQACEDLYKRLRRPQDHWKRSVWRGPPLQVHRNRRTGCDQENEKEGHDKEE